MFNVITEQSYIITNKKFFFFIELKGLHFSMQQEHDKAGPTLLIKASIICQRPLQQVTGILWSIIPHSRNVNTATVKLKNAVKYLGETPQDFSPLRFS